MPPPRFADGFHVLAPDRRGFGESETVDRGQGTAAQAADILGFMDAVGLDRAVMVGNIAGPTTLMTYLGEHHPDRVAAIVYLTHMAPGSASPRDAAVAEFWDMASRTACDWDEETRQRQTEADDYRPQFIDDPDFRIDVPALSLANEEGTRYPAGFDFVGVLLRQVDIGEWCDAAAKAYFAALAADTARAMTTESDTVQVAPPTGEHEVDRASILAALGKVPPGGTVRFAAGNYLVGELIRVETPRITLLGHPDGTTLRGCDPAEEAERRARFACHGRELTGGHQTVRHFTFERAHFDLVVGCCVAAPRTGETPPPGQDGGYLIEENTFRESSVGVRVMGGSPDPTVIRNNVFLNMRHAVGVNGGTVHIIENDISALEPDRIPLKHAIGAIGVGPLAQRECGRNVIAGNRIEGHPDGITLRVWMPGTSCRQNVIRDNTIIVRRVRLADRREGFRIADEAVRRKRP